MKVIATLSAKGGTGKSTLARGLISAAAARGFSTGFIETDSEEATYLWAQNAGALGYWDPEIQGYSVAGAQELGEAIVELDNRSRPGAAPSEDSLPPLDILVVDTAGARDDLEEALLTAADLIIVPFNLTELATHTSLRTATYVFTMAEMNPELGIAKLRGIINQRPRKMTAILREVDARLRMPDVLENTHTGETAPLPLFDVEVSDRDAYRQMESRGLLHRLVDAHDNPRLRIQQKHFHDALDEMGQVLDAALADMGDADE